MTFITRQEPFVCEACAAAVQPLEHGTCRNHCPVCLSSKHVDLAGPGDRASSCGGLMEAVGLDQSAKKGFIIMHKCKECGVKRRNKAAPDDDLHLL